VSKWRPCKRRDFIKKLKKLGFENPEYGTRHAVMRYGSYKQIIPSNSEFSIPQLKVLLRQIEEKLGRKITLEEWDGL
jgi:predicted RNA binding protein YcfA (HicA-like mRNA interferase family)